MAQSHNFNCDQFSRSTLISKLLSNWTTGEIPVYDGGHLQGRLQLSDEGEEECIKGRNWQLGQSKLQFFSTKTHIENGIVEVRPRVLLVEKSSFEAKVISNANLKTFSDWAQVQSKEGQVQRRHDSYWHLQRMQSKNYDDFEIEFNEKGN